MFKDYRLINLCDKDHVLINKESGVLKLLKSICSKGETR